MKSPEMGRGEEFESEQESKIETDEKVEFESEQESINDPILCDLYRHADDAGRYERSLKEIKQTAKEIALNLYKLGVTNLPPESNLGKALIRARKIEREYPDVEQAQSGMREVASLISKSDGFRDASKKWRENKG